MDAGVLALVCVVVALAAVSIALTAAVVGQHRVIRGLQRSAEESRREAREPRTVAVQPLRQETEYVITEIGRVQEPEGEVVPDRLVLSAALGEPLVKVVALAYGIRRGLSAENRNRILFQVRREVRRSRKDRRREMRQAWREMKQQEAP